MRSIYDELESQVTESKSKLDASTDIIRKLEIELDKGEDAIQSIKAPICEIA